MYHSYAEVHNFLGRSDVIIQFKDVVYVFKFKFAKTEKCFSGKKKESLEQIEEKRYAQPYASIAQRVEKIAVAVDDAKRQAAFFPAACASQRPRRTLP